MAVALRGGDAVGAAAADRPTQSMTPLPTMQVFIVAACNFINSFAYLLTVPLVPFMVMAFFPGLAASEVGYYSGLVEGSFHAGGLIGAFVWSWVADRYGRRPALLYGLAGTVFFSALFGLSGSLWQAMATKFAWGLLNGNIGVAKTALSELCDDTNSARAFSYIGVSTGSGRLFGPMVGALMYAPATQYPALFASDGFFAVFPFFLPCLACAAITAAVFALGAIYLEETLGREAAMIARVLGPAAAAGAALPTPAKALRPANALASTSCGRSCGGPCVTRTLFCGGAPCAYVRSARRLLSDSGIAGTFNLSTLMALVGLWATELYPIYLVNDVAHAGFSWNANDVGALVSVCGPFVLLWSLLLYDRAVARFGLLSVFRASLACHALALFATPACSLALRLRAPGGGEAQPAVHVTELAAIATVFIFSNLSRVTGFNSIFILVANSAHPEDRSAVNGLGQAAASLMRAVGPPLGSAVFARSVSDANARAGWPVNIVASWYIVALLTLATLALSYTLPAWIERKRPADARLGELAATCCSLSTAARRNASGYASVGHAPHAGIDDDDGYDDDDDDLAAATVARVKIPAVAGGGHAPLAAERGGRPHGSAQAAMHTTDDDQDNGVLEVEALDDGQPRRA